MRKIASFCKPIRRVKLSCSGTCKVNRVCCWLADLVCRRLPVSSYWRQRPRLWGKTANSCKRERSERVQCMPFVAEMSLFFRPCFLPSNHGTNCFYESKQRLSVVFDPLIPFDIIFRKHGAIPHRCSAYWNQCCNQANSSKHFNPRLSSSYDLKSLVRVTNSTAVELPGRTVGINKVSRPF